MNDYESTIKDDNSTITVNLNLVDDYTYGKVVKMSVDNSEPEIINSDNIDQVIEGQINNLDPVLKENFVEGFNRNPYKEGKKTIIQREER